MRALVHSTVRTVDEQDELYAKGRTAPGDIVTYVRGGDSWHNYGLAVDLAIAFPDGTVDWGSKLYEEIGQKLAPKYPELLWGGNFPAYYGGDFRDLPHWEMHLSAKSVRDLPFGPAYAEGECTWYVNEQARVILHTDALTFRKYPGLPDRDAKVFDTLADTYAIARGNTPRVNSVAQWKIGQYGHVAWVTAVHADGTFDVSESNYHLDHRVGTRTNLPASGVSAFIYVGEKKVADVDAQGGRSVALQATRADGTPCNPDKPQPPHTSCAAVTTYNPKVEQNDGDPWTGASGRMAEGHMALSRDLLAPTKDHPDYTGTIPYGTAVTLHSPGEDARCNATYTVTDTTNARFKKRADVFRISASGNFSCKHTTITW
jgi:surface antigen